MLAFGSMIEVYEGDDIVLRPVNSLRRGDVVVDAITLEGSVVWLVEGCEYGDVVYQYMGLKGTGGVRVMSPRGAFAHLVHVGSECTYSLKVSMCVLTLASGTGAVRIDGAVAIMPLRNVNIKVRNVSPRVGIKKPVRTKKPCVPENSVVCTLPAVVPVEPVCCVADVLRLLSCTEGVA